MKKYFFILCFTVLAQGQEIVWPESPGPVTALSIHCDTKNIPIFIDGEPVGVSPLSAPVQVAPGWHQVSYFPNHSMNPFPSSEMRKMNDIIRLARQDVLVEEGETVKVVLSYRSIEHDVEAYQQSLQSHKWVGLVMVLVTMTLLIWGLT